MQKLQYKRVQEEEQEFGLLQFKFIFLLADAEDVAFAQVTHWLKS